MGEGKHEMGERAIIVLGCDHPYERPCDGGSKQAAAVV